MELDLQSLFGPHVYSCAPWLRPPPPPTSPSFCLIYEGAIGQPRWTTSICHPLVFPMLQNKYGDLRYLFLRCLQQIQAGGKILTVIFSRLRTWYVLFFSYASETGIETCGIYFSVATQRPGVKFCPSSSADRERAVCLGFFLCFRDRYRGPAVFISPSLHRRTAVKFRPSSSADRERGMFWLSLCFRDRYRDLRYLFLRRYIETCGKILSVIFSRQKLAVCFGFFLCFRDRYRDRRYLFLRRYIG